MNIKEKHPRKLLVEGNDDQHVVWAICQQFTIPETFDVVDSKGITKLVSDIAVRAKQAGVQSLGILADTDDNEHGNRWKQITDKLKGLNYSIPESPNPLGTIIPSPAPNRPRVGIWLMPDNQAPGMIEDFIRFLVPTGDESLALAEETITTLEDRSLQRYIPNHRAKALIHTWLAWQENPGTPLGQAITKRYLTTDTNLCQQFADWLRRLFT